MYWSQSLSRLKLSLIDRTPHSIALLVSSLFLIVFVFVVVAIVAIVGVFCIIKLVCVFCCCFVTRNQVAKDGGLRHGPLLITTPIALQTTPSDSSHHVVC